MLEILLRLLGLKRRRRRVYAQPPMPPGMAGAAKPRTRVPGAASVPVPGQQLRRDAELQTAEQAEKVRRARELQKAGPLARLPLIGGWFRPARKRRDIRMPAPPPGMVPEVEAGAEGEAAVPVVRGRSSRRARLPRRTFRDSLRELRKEFESAWSGPVGGAARLVLKLVIFVVLPISAIAVPSYLIVTEMKAIGIEVEPFSVPEKTAKTGRTPEVMAQLLIDQMDSLRREVALDKTDRWPQDLGGRPVPFLVSTQGDTLHQLAVWVRGLTLQPVRFITGSVTEVEDGKLSLRIYVTGMNNGAPVASLDGFNPEDLNRVVAGAAPLMLRAISPRVYGWYVSNKEQRFEAQQEALHSLLNEPSSGRVDAGTRDTVEFLLARGLLRAGRTEEALEVIEPLIKRSPGYAPGYYAKAMALQAQGDADEARNMAEEARRIDGGNAWSYKVTGRILLSQGKLADALTDIRVARRLDPNDGSAIVMEAETLLNMRRIEEASAAVRAGLERAPGQPGILESAAGVMLARGRPDTAIGLINNELRQHPERVSALVVKARLLSALGRGADALEAAETAIRLQPTNGIAQAARAYALVAVGRPSEGLKMFETLMAVAPDNPTLLQGRALALAAVGRKEEAIDAFRKVLELAPDFGAARRELDRLEGREPTARTGVPGVPAAASAPAAPRPGGDNFTAAPVDVGPAPAPAIPRAERSELPMALGMFMNQRGGPRAPFRRPDSENP